MSDSIAIEPDSFAGLIQSALDTALSPEVVQAKVTKEVEKIVDGIIRDSFCSWSGAGKDVKEAVSKSLMVGDHLNLPSYGHTVCRILETQIEARVAEVVGAKLKEDMEELLTLAPKEAKLSELIEVLLGDDDDPCNCFGDGRVYLNIEWEDGRSFIWVHLSQEEVTRSHEADIRLLVHLEDQTEEEKAQDWPPPRRATICSGHVKGSDLKKDVQFGFGTNHSKQRREFGSWDAFGQKVLSMYAVGTVIELDEDACVLSHSDRY